MAISYSVDDLLEFLTHAADRGLMPTATAQALAVASRKVLAVLTDQEKQDLRGHDLDATIQRFTNKRAKDFNPSSLKEYSRRVHRAVELFIQWRGDPANFTVNTRTTTATRKKSKTPEVAETPVPSAPSTGTETAGTFQSSVPVRTGVVVTIANVPSDLSKAEAERIAGFVRMLAVAP